MCGSQQAWKFGCVDHKNLWKLLKEMGTTDHVTCLLKNLYACQEETELEVEQRTGSKLGKEYVKAVYEDEMVGRHHRLDGHGFGWTPGAGDGQGGLVGCDVWGCRV